MTEKCYTYWFTATGWSLWITPIEVILLIDDTYCNDLATDKQQNVSKRWQRHNTKQTPWLETTNHCLKPLPLFKKLIFWNSFSLQIFEKTYLTTHSKLSGLWMKLKLLSTGPLQGERACIRDLEYILFEILY